MPRVLKGSDSFTCNPPYIHQQNEPYLPLPFQPKLVLIYRPRRDGRLSWPRVAGWLHTAMSVRQLNPDTVTYLSANRTRRNFVDRSQSANHYARPPDRNAVAALHQDAPGQMTWLEDTPPWLRPAYCFATVIVWTANKNVTISDRFICFSLTVKQSAAMPAFVFWGRRLK